MRIPTFVPSTAHFIQTRQTTRWGATSSPFRTGKIHSAKTAHAPTTTSSHGPRVRMPTMQSTSDSDASATVEEQFESEDYLHRIRAINRVHEIESTSRQVEILVRLVTQDENPQVRYAAISRLSNLGAARLSDTEGQAVLEAARHALATDKEPSCQAGAADLIAGLRLTDGFDDLVSTFAQTKDWMLKFSIAAGMGEMGDARAFDFLKGVLEDENENQEFLLVAAAIGALGELGDQRALPVIDMYVDHEDSSIKERAMIAKAVLSGDDQSGSSSNA